MRQIKTKQSKATENIQSWIIPMVLIVLASVIAIVMSSTSYNISNTLRYENTLLASGEYWRLITGHFVHLSWTHLGLNIAGTVIVWELIKNTLNTKQWTLSIVLLCVFISVCFLLFDTALVWYVGLSGLLHGLLFQGMVLKTFHEYRLTRTIAWLELALLLGLIFKLLFEQNNGILPWSSMDIGGEVVVNAHLYGAIIGTILALIYMSVMNKNVAR